MLSSLTFGLISPGSSPNGSPRNDANNFGVSRYAELKQELEENAANEVAIINQLLDLHLFNCCT